MATDYTAAMQNDNTEAVYQDQDGYIVLDDDTPYSKTNLVPVRIPMKVSADTASIRLGIGTNINVTQTTDYEELINKPSINGVELIGDKSSEDLGLVTAEYVDEKISEMPHGLPAGGNIGDLLTKRSLDDYDIEWITPATSVEQDNTRPITAAAVYMEIGNINALLATI